MYNLSQKITPELWNGITRKQDSEAICEEKKTERERSTDISFPFFQ